MTVDEWMRGGDDRISNSEQGITNVEGNESMPDARWSRLNTGKGGENPEEKIL